jgi:hypothetical protein
MPVFNNYQSGLLVNINFFQKNLQGTNTLAYLVRPSFIFQTDLHKFYKVRRTIILCKAEANLKAMPTLVKMQGTNTLAYSTTPYTHLLRFSKIL